MAKQLHCILPVHHLKEAEAEHIDVADIVAPYLDALTNDNGEDWPGFYDHMTELLPLAGDNEDVYFDKNKGEIVNFDLLCASVVSAIAPIKNEIEGKVPVPAGYHVASSKKIDDSSVAITLKEDLVNNQGMILEDQRRSRDDKVQADIDKLKRIHYEGLNIPSDMIEQLVRDDIDVKEGETVHFDEVGNFSHIEPAGVAMQNARQCGKTETVARMNKLAANSRFGAHASPLEQLEFVPIAPGSKLSNICTDADMNHAINK